MEALFDFGWMSALLIVGQFLRSRLRWVRQCHLPTAMLAGLLALAGGPQGFNVIPFQLTPQGSPAFLGYPTLLVVVLFATMFLSGAAGRSGSLSQALTSAGDTLWVGLGVMLGQYGLALTAGAMILSQCFPEMPAPFALLMPAAFAGGPGTAAAYGASFEQQGLAEAVPVGMVLATIGLAAGNAGGMALVNLAIRRGWTRIVTADNAHHGSNPEIVAVEARSSLGQASVSASSMEALTWPLAAVLTAVVLAVGIQSLAVASVPAARDLPLFVCAMPAAFAVRGLLNWLLPDNLPDDAVIQRIGSLATDYLIAFGIASVKVATIQTLGWPILALALLGMAYTVGVLWFAGPRLYRHYWFERSIFTYGWNMGVVATGVALLRSVDPEFRTRTLDHFALAYLVIGPTEIALVILLPWCAAQGHLLIPGIILCVCSLGCFALSASLVGVFPASTTAVRDGE